MFFHTKCFSKANWNSFCGGVFTESSGKIISPNYPKKYPNNVRCNYTILMPGKLIQLTFKSFDLEGILIKSHIFSFINY